MTPVMVPVMLLAANVNVSTIVVRLCPPPVSMMRGGSDLFLPRTVVRIEPPSPPKAEPGPFDTLIETIEGRLKALRAETDPESADMRRETIREFEKLLDECKRRNKKRDE